MKRKEKKERRKTPAEREDSRNDSKNPAKIALASVSSQEKLGRGKRKTESGGSDRREKQEKKSVEQRRQHS